MRDANRIGEILGLIEEYWTKNPDQRFFQALTNLGIYKPIIYADNKSFEPQIPNDQYYQEDDEILAILKGKTAEDNIIKL